MQKKFNCKFNDGCIKIFKFLDLLYNDKAEYEDVMRIFLEECDNDSKKEHVILNKYLNTLKVFGIKVDKINNRYIMHNAPFALKFDIDDLKTVKYLMKYSEALPEGKLKNNLDNMLKTITSRFSLDTKKTFESLQNTTSTDFSFYYANIREQIQHCETICQDHYKVNVRYLQKNKEVVVTGNPQEIIFENKTAYLRVYKIPAHESIDILITNILSIDRLPTQKDTFENQSPVVFKLTGRLAEVYKLKEGETLTATEADGAKIITNKLEPHESLLRRLLRYDSSCVVLRPKTVRTRMVDIINGALQKYE